MREPSVLVTRTKGHLQSHVLVVLSFLSVLHVNFPQGLNTLPHALLRHGSEGMIDGVPGLRNRQTQKERMSNGYDEGTK